MLEKVTAALNAMGRTSNRRTACELCVIELCGFTGSLLTEEPGVSKKAFTPDTELPKAKTPKTAKEPELVKEPEPCPDSEAKAETPAQKQAEIPAESLEDASKVWKNILGILEKVLDIPLFCIISNGGAVSADFNGDTLTVFMKNPFELNMFSTPENTQHLRTAALEAIGRPVAVNIKQDDRKPVLNTEKLNSLSRFENVKFE